MCLMWSDKINLKKVEITLPKILHIVFCLPACNSTASNNMDVNKLQGNTLWQATHQHLFIMEKECIFLFYWHRKPLWFDGSLFLSGVVPGITVWVQASPEEAVCTVLCKTTGSCRKEHSIQCKVFILRNSFSFDTFTIKCRHVVHNGI